MGSLFREHAVPVLHTVGRQVFVSLSRTCQVALMRGLQSSLKAMFIPGPMVTLEDGKKDGLTGMSNLSFP